MPGVLYVVTCAAGPAGDVGVLVELAQADGWDVCCILTPSARNFVDATALEVRTGHPVRTEYKKPGEPTSCPCPTPSSSHRRPSTRSTSGRPGSATRWPSV